MDPAILERFFDDIAPVEKDMLARSEIRKLGKLGYFKKRFFLPERNLEQYHPIVYKYKILRFPYAVFRVVRGVLFRRGKFMGEIKELQRKDD